PLSSPIHPAIQFLSLVTQFYTLRYPSPNRYFTFRHINPTMPRSLKSLNALVTGGASGLGAVIAHRLAAEGVNICLNGLPSDKAGAKDHCEALTKEFGVKSTYVLADVSTPD